MTKAGLIASLVLCTLACASCGPRMRLQPSIKPYEISMPSMPAGTVPTIGRLETYTQQQSNLGTSPIARTTANINDGRIYYTYYCIQCHGEDGSGNGPVGQSYVPKPTDLSSAAVTSLPDGQLYLRMLHGVGHDPVMMQTVLPQHRWPLVLYLRTFRTAPKAPAAPM